MKVLRCCVQAFPDVTHLSTQGLPSLLINLCSGVTCLSPICLLPPNSELQDTGAVTVSQQGWGRTRSGTFWGESCGAFWVFFFFLFPSLIAAV